MYYSATGREFFRYWYWVVSSGSDSLSDLKTIAPKFSSFLSSRVGGGDTLEKVRMDGYNGKIVVVDDLAADVEDGVEEGSK